MSTFKTLTSVALIGATALTFSVPAISAPIMVQPQQIQSSASLPTENVQYYRGGGYGRGYGYGGGYRGRGYGYRGGGGNGALIGGLAAGAIIGGAIAAGAAQQNAQAQQNANYCAQRYRSYDPQSGTYLNNDGNRYACP
jgi:hypothetical protein